MAIIGRSRGVDIILPYPQVSARHAGVAPTPDGMLAVTDLGSTNGTHVEGKRIAPEHAGQDQAGRRASSSARTPIYLGIEGNDGARLGRLGPTPTGPATWSRSRRSTSSSRCPTARTRPTKKVLLNHVTFKAHPGDLIALMGPSGAGKTTLLTVLNGYLRPTSGEVRVNGESLYAIYDALRGSIGYVPQDDIVHPELTVFEAIKYSAQFRLPPDYGEEEIDRRVEQVIKDLGLEQVKNLEIGKPERKVLSGGQRKRVNIALELVTDPALMFLDEPTSGLAADDTVALIDLLASLAKKYGKTIIVTIHQPAREEYEKFNLALIMGFGGEPVYYGPTGKESYEFFGRYVAHEGHRHRQPARHVRPAQEARGGRDRERQASPTGRSARAGGGGGVARRVLRRRRTRPTARCTRARASPARRARAARPRRADGAALPPVLAPLQALRDRQAARPRRHGHPPRAGADHRRAARAGLLRPGQDAEPLVPAVPPGRRERGAAEGARRSPPACMQDIVALHQGGGLRRAPSSSSRSRRSGSARATRRARS